MYLLWLRGNKLRIDDNDNYYYVKINVNNFDLFCRSAVHVCKLQVFS